VKACAITIHAVEMLNDRYRIRQVTGAIWAPVIELPSNKFLVFFAINFSWPVLADPATQLVKKHAD
jgi:hypothetical protein